MYSTACQRPRLKRMQQFEDLEDEILTVCVGVVRIQFFLFVVLFCGIVFVF